MAEALPLQGWTIAVPESRELDLFSDMIEQRGAEAYRCPLVAIYDSPRENDIKNWMNRFIGGDFDDLIILTGEGVRRLNGFAERFGLSAVWEAGLASVRKIVRGPKPGRVLRTLKLKPDVLASAPTTDGVIETLRSEDLQGRKIAVQLYGEDPNDKLQNFLREKGAEVFPVAPYIYAPDTETTNVILLVDKIISKKVDVVVFTSMQQVPRLLSVAKKQGKFDALHQAMQVLVIAAIGPVVADKLIELDIPVTLQPDGKFFMKPMVRKLMEYAQEHSPGIQS